MNYAQICWWINSFIALPNWISATDPNCLRNASVFTECMHFTATCGYMVCFLELGKTNNVKPWNFKMNSNLFWNKQPAHGLHPNKNTYCNYTQYIQLRWFLASLIVYTLHNSLQTVVQSKTSQIKFSHIYIRFLLQSKVVYTVMMGFLKKTQIVRFVWIYRHYLWQIKNKLTNSHCVFKTKENK